MPAKYALLCCFLICGLAHATETKTTAEPVGIRLAFDPPTLDWNLGDVPIHVMNNVIEGLYAVDQNGKVVPDQARAFPARGGDNVLRIKLKPGLKWSDGRPVTAQDYVDSWRRLLDPATASTYSYLLFPLQGARDFNTGRTKTWSGASAAGAAEIELRLEAGVKTFSPSVLTHWATFPIRKELITKHGRSWTRPALMAFNGPYRIESYQADVKLTLVPNGQHRSPGTISRIDAYIVQDDATALQLYETGKLHFMPELGGLERAALRTRKDYRSLPSPVLVYVGTDTRHPNLKLPKQRRAVSQALDRRTIPTVLAADHEPTMALLPGALGKARAPGSPAPSRIEAPSPLEFGYFIKGSNQTLCELLQAQWKKAGLQTELRGSEVKTYWVKLAQKPQPLFLNSFGPPVWDAGFYYGLLTSDNPMNMGRWANTEYDRAVAVGNLARAQAIFEREQPIVPLYFRAYDYLISPRLKGAVVNPMTSLFLDRAQLTAR